MPSLTIRNVGKPVMDALKDRAAKSGRSVEEEGLAILRALAKSDNEEAFARMRALGIKVRNPKALDSVEAVKKGRMRRLVRAQAK